MPLPQHMKHRWATGNGAPGEIAYDKQFFSGQDCFVFLYPHYAQRLIPLPATQLQFGMSQQKQPIYGAWSYRWDAVARGQVIVQGELSLVFSKPNFLGQLLGKESQSDNPPRESDGSVQPLIDSTKSIETTQRKDLRDSIWGKSTDGSTPAALKNPSSLYGNNIHRTTYPFGRDSWARANGKPEADYAGHQPFDIIICYGSNPSMNFTDNSQFNYQTWIESTKDYMRMMSTTPNEAARGWSPSNRMRIEAVELMSAGTVLEVSGQPLQETYTFIARDLTTPLAK